MIEYDVAMVDRSQYAHSPLLVEVEKSPGALLGINLAVENNAKTNNQRGAVVESITPASIAERFYRLLHYKNNRDNHIEIINYHF